MLGKRGVERKREEERKGKEGKLRETKISIIFESRDSFVGEPTLVVIFERLGKIPVKKSHLGE